MNGLVASTVMTSLYTPFLIEIITGSVLPDGTAFNAA
jgi:hypothetical protein